MRSYFVVMAFAAATSPGAGSAAAPAVHRGRDCRDAFLGLAKTCAKLAISFWDYLGDRLAVPGAKAIPQLPELIIARAQAP